MLSYLLLGSVCVANVLLGIFVIKNNPKVRLNQYFFFLAVALAAWSLVTFLEDTGYGRQVIQALAYLDYGLSILMAVLFFGLCYEFSRVKLKLVWPLVAILASANIVLLGLGLIVSTRLEGESVKFIEGDGFLAFIGLLVVTILGGLFLLAWRYRRSGGTERAQIRVIYFGLFLMSAGLVLTNVVLPNIMSVSPAVTRLGIYSILSFTGFTAYAIIKHRFMDIRLVVARSVAYSLLIGTLAMLYAGAVFGVSFLFFPGVTATSAQTGVYAALAILLAFTFQPLRHFFEKLTDRVFFRDRYDTQEVLNKVGKVLTAELHLENILNRTLKILSEELRIGRAQFIVFEGPRIYKIGHYGPLPEKLLTAPELRVLNHRMLIADELEGGERKNLMMSHGVRLSLAIRTKEEFVGFLLLGDKLSGDIYSAQDVKLLEILGSEVAVAIINAKAYEEIAQFNVTLQDKIAQATQNLRVANRHLKELDKAKDEFISMASHQLRTPLTTIKGYLSMLEEGDAGRLKPQQQEFVTNAYEGSERMVRLISDLLNVSRMSTGKFLIEKKPTNLAEMVSDEVRQLQMHANNKGLKLSFVPPKRKLPLVSVDEAKTRQVVMNFIDNAIYYTKSGSVTVYLDQHDGHARMRVVDTGIGVPKEAHKQLFTKFFRAGNAQNVRPDGTGLGLFLAKKVIQDQGGKIIFDSVEGKGSIFGFEIPLDSRSKATPKAAPSAKVEIGVN